jgi:hypothetical protein
MIGTSLPSYGRGLLAAAARKACNRRHSPIGDHAGLSCTEAGTEKACRKWPDLGIRARLAGDRHRGATTHRPDHIAAYKRSDARGQP